MKVELIEQGQSASKYLVGETEYIVMHDPRFTNWAYLVMHGLTIVAEVKNPALLESVLRRCENERRTLV